MSEPTWHGSKRLLRQALDEMEQSRNEYGRRLFAAEAQLEAIQQLRKTTEGDPQALVDGLACLLGEPNI